MRPQNPEEIYKITAQRLNLPEQYVKDAVEYYYLANKTKMHSMSYVKFTLHGLGKFVIRPLKFWRRLNKLRTILGDFGVRRDNRGIMIRKELEIRAQQMEELGPEVQKYFEFRQKQMYGSKKDLEK